MTREELDAELNLAINTTDHEAYAAKARVAWPSVLLELRQAMDDLDELSVQRLRDSRLIMAGDQLAIAIHEFMTSMATNMLVNEAAEKLVEATERYQEVRGFGRRDRE